MHSVTAVALGVAMPGALPVCCRATFRDSPWYGSQNHKAETVSISHTNSSDALDKCNTETDLSKNVTM